MSIERLEAETNEDGQTQRQNHEPAAQVSKM